jgi:outer membrane protein assembly factor BamC
MQLFSNGKYLPMSWKIAAVLACLLVSSCSYLTGDDGVFRDRKYDYRKAEQAPRMEIPEGLDRDAIVDFYTIPPQSPYADYVLEEVPLPVVMTGEAGSVVRIQKMGDLSWILLQVPASQAWPRLKEFVSRPPLALVAEDGSRGVIEAASEEGRYRFQVDQGFQRNTAEILVQSGDSEKAHIMMEGLAAFLADVSGKPAYSFAAQGITTRQKMSVENREDGSKALLLATTRQRAMASLAQALEKAGFLIRKEKSGSDYWVVRYTPPFAAGENAGYFATWFDGWFGYSAPAYDKDAEYADHRYRFWLDEKEGMQRIQVERLGKNEEDPAVLRRELNQQLLLVKGHIH